MPHTCPNCGARTTPTLHTLKSGHISALLKFRQAVRHYNRNRVHIRKEMADLQGAPFQLTKDEWTNFTKLRYFGLVAHADEKNRRSGYWLLTLNGGRFLRGEIVVPAQVKTFRDKIVARSSKTIALLEFQKQLPAFEKEFNYETRKSGAQTMPLFLS